MRYIQLDQEKKVIAIRHGDSIVPGEMQSELGELGQIMQQDGTFVHSETAPTEPVESIDQKIDRLEKQVQEDNLMQFEVLATIYETLVTGGN